MSNFMQYVKGGADFTGWNLGGDDGGNFDKEVSEILSREFSNGELDPWISLGGWPNRNESLTKLEVSISFNPFDDSGDVLFRIEFEEILKTTLDEDDKELFDARIKAFEDLLAKYKNLSSQTE